MKSQTAKILAWLMKGRSLTAIQALEHFGCFRLAARINDIRALGYNIVTNWQYKAGKRFASYKLAA